MDEEDSVRKQLLDDNLYFKRLLDLIPMQFYFDESSKQKLRGEEDIEDDDDETDGSDLEGKTAKKQKPGQKRPAGELSDKALWKRKKFDPAQIKTVTDLQEELIEAEKLEKLGKSKKVQKSNGPSTDLFASGADSEDLRERLHHKIHMMEAKRKNMTKSDALEKKKMKRRESKMKLKMRRQTEKQNKVKGQDRAGDKAMTPNGKKSPGKPIYNKEGKMVFSKFDFRDGGEKERKSDVPTGKNYKKLLEKVQKQKDKISKLQVTDKDAAKELQEKTQWKTVLQKAEGVKVKDDATLIKKSIKRKEKLKQKSKKEWDERDKKLKEQMQGRKDKRKANIQKKKKLRTDKKIQKGKKKGHILPGF